MSKTPFLTKRKQITRAYPKHSGPNYKNKYRKKKLSEEHRAAISRGLKRHHAAKRRGNVPKATNKYRKPKTSKPRYKLDVKSERRYNKTQYVQKKVPRWKPRAKPRLIKKADKGTFARKPY